jgi:hypothetical protein
MHEQVCTRSLQLDNKVGHRVRRVVRDGRLNCSHRETANVSYEGEELEMTPSPQAPQPRRTSCCINTCLSIINGLAGLRLPERASYCCYRRRP